MASSPPEVVQSVAKALSLLTCFADQSGGLSLTDLARRNEMNVSTAYRLLLTLCSTQILRRDPVTELFHPGPMLVRLGRSALLQSGFVEALTILQGVADETRETTSIGIRVQDCVSTILTVPSPEVLRVHDSVGNRVPLEVSAMGRAILAFAGDTMDNLRTPPALTEFTLRSPVKLKHEIAATRYRQYALLDQERTIGVRAMASPILNSNHVALGAIGIEGPVSRITDERLGSLARVLTAASASLRELPIYAI